MSDIFNYESSSADIVISVFNYISTRLSRASEYFKLFTDNVETYRKGTSCKDFAEVYKASSGIFKEGVIELNSGIFKEGVIEISNIIMKSNELYNALYNSDFDSSVQRGRELAYLFQGCVLPAIGRLHDMAIYLQLVFDMTVECCLDKERTQGKEGPFVWYVKKGKEQENLMKALERGLEHNWSDVLVVFPPEEIGKYGDFCEYFSKHATVENLAILFKGFATYFMKVKKFVDSLLEKAKQYKEGQVGSSEIIEPLRVCLGD
jgi:hypothetical protein